MTVRIGLRTHWGLGCHPIELESKHIETFKREKPGQVFYG